MKVVSRSKDDAGAGGSRASSLLDKLKNPRLIAELMDSDDDETPGVLPFDDSCHRLSRLKQLCTVSLSFFFLFFFFFLSLFFGALANATSHLTGTRSRDRPKPALTAEEARRGANGGAECARRRGRSVRRH